MVLSNPAIVPSTEVVQSHTSSRAMSEGPYFPTSLPTECVIKYFTFANPMGKEYCYSSNLPFSYYE